MAARDDGNLAVVTLLLRVGGSAVYPVGAMSRALSLHPLTPRRRRPPAFVGIGKNRRYHIARIDRFTSLLLSHTEMGHIELTFLLHFLFTARPARYVIYSFRTAQTDE